MNREERRRMMKKHPKMRDFIKKRVRETVDKMGLNNGVDEFYEEVRKPIEEKMGKNFR